MSITTVSTLPPNCNSVWALSKLTTVRYSSASRFVFKILQRLLYIFQRFVHGNFLDPSEIEAHDDKVADQHE